MSGGKEIGVDKNVEFLYKTMMQRDPRKRQVKLVKPHLMQIDFASLEDSSDDSDFKLNSDADEDDFDDDDDNAGKQQANNENSSSDDDDDDSEDESDDDDDDDDDDSSKTKEKRKSDDHQDKENAAKKRKLNEDENTADDTHSSAKSDQQQDDEDVALKNDLMKRRVVPVCSVCLGDSNALSNEIVECDGCHETVHEGCFGVSDSHSNSSSDSSSSMEPWFCDSCKAGVQPHCELCPNEGGIFKETDAGRWVHLICALYAKGVAFGDVDRLSNVTLFEMPYSRWGAKECSLCEDARFSRTGVCISCDAGMCRQHFHVTCAQKQGLLTEASGEEAKAIADPYFAYCKIHSDKHLMRHNHRNWLALRSNVRSADKNSTFSEADKARLKKKLTSHQKKYEENKFNRQQCWVPKEKMSRMLLNNSYALKQLLRKAELQGIIEDVSAKDMRKKGYTPPAFSVDFVSYYLERNELMEMLKGKNKEMHQQSKEMRKTEMKITEDIERTNNEIQTLTNSSLQTQKGGLLLWDYMMNIAGKRIRIPECVSFRNFARTPTKDLEQISSTNQLSKCAICHQSHDQHLLATCDSCHGNYHLSCLDPPLTRTPKKTKSQGWQCSFCTKEEISKEEEAMPTDLSIDRSTTDGSNKTRRLREKRMIKEPLKYTSEFTQDNITRIRDKKVKPKSNLPPASHEANKRNNLASSNPTATDLRKPKPFQHIVGNQPANSPFSISSEEGVESDKPATTSGEDGCSQDSTMKSMEVVNIIRPLVEQSHFVTPEVDIEPLTNQNLPLNLSTLSNGPLPGFDTFSSIGQKHGPIMLKVNPQAGQSPIKNLDTLRNLADSAPSQAHVQSLQAPQNALPSLVDASSHVKVEKKTKTTPTRKKSEAAKETSTNQELPTKVTKEVFIEISDEEED